MTVSRTAAIAQARRLITPGRQGRMWVTYTPEGASRPRDFWANRAYATVARAELALRLMGFTDPSVRADCEYAARDGEVPIAWLVKTVAAKQERS